MTGKIFVDTNVFVYAHDRSEPGKRQRALEVLDRLVAAGIGVYSTQVLSEFYNTSTRNIPEPLLPGQAYDQIKYFLQVWETLVVTETVILEAIQGVRKYQLSFWDAQIWAAARMNQVGVIFSEDFNPGAVIEGVQFVNPFAEDFQLEEWGL